VGVAVGTSSGGMESATRLFALRRAGKDVPPELARATTYFAPLDAAIARLGVPPARVTQVLAACAASTIAIGLAARWLDAGLCDVVIAGGYDAVTPFVAAGFEVLRATSPTRPRPFRMGRDGMALGEGAALVALVRGDDAQGAGVLARFSGFGASTDAVHITAPDRTGAGLARAARAALVDASTAAAEIDLVSAHGTATPFNDAMEARAIAAALDGASPVVHPMKAEIGHTLGAAGVLEALAAAAAIARGVAPAAAGEGELDDDARVTLLERCEARSIGAALKLSAAFGGTNAALVLRASPSGRAPRAPRDAFVTASARADDASTEAVIDASGLAIERVARLDDVCRLGVAAVGRLAAAVGRARLEGAGVVAGHALATIDTNARFDARLARGPQRADPRLFPATSPNALAGECAIAFGLTGPGFSVGAGLDGATEALAAAALLVAAGDADRVVVVAADDAGPCAREVLAALRPGGVEFARGGIAMLVEATPRGADSWRVSIDVAADHARSSVGHLALLEITLRGPERKKRESNKSTRTRA
ncbi:MAG TPA: beta-ketoacyl synthase N-terminal-like domain-containing protein, partial [Byssovorax sp.]